MAIRPLTTQEKYEQPNDFTFNGFDAEDGISSLNTEVSSDVNLSNPRIGNLSVPPGAEKQKRKDPQVNFKGQSSAISELGEDRRVKIRVPSQYLTFRTSGYNGQLAELGGIIFPYTPQISFEHKADYTEMKPLHSNFTINFYQRSSVSSIQINGKFTVESQQDSQNYIATQHLLRALTRMKFGLDSDAGAPPPVCRLDAYGDMFLKNVPVVIGNYRVEYPDDVDYYQDFANKTSVPTRSTISVTCIPMYSRNEMQQFSVNEYLTSVEYKKKGYI